VKMFTRKYLQEEGEKWVKWIERVVNNKQKLEQLIKTINKEIVKERRIRNERYW